MIDSEISETSAEAAAGLNLSGCALAIDPATFAIVAATNEACVALGLRAAALPISLDAAQPLAVTVRALAAAGGNARQPSNRKPSHDGQLWGRSLTRPVPVSLRLAKPPSGPALVIVTFDRPASRGPDIARDEDAPRLVRSDAETLQAIAVAIRSGVVPKLATPAPPEPTAGLPIAKLAHELKTPLGGILAATEIMRDQRFGPIANARYLDYLADMHEAAHHALTLVGRWSRDGGMEGPGEGATTGTFDLNAAVRACAGVMRPWADRLAIKLDVAVPRGELMIAADPTAVRQIVFNLLANAVKFTPAGGVVNVHTGQEQDGGICLAIRDTGVGLDLNEARRLLDTAPAVSRSDRQPLGLSVVGDLARANGAAVECESQPGEGTTVRVIFASDR